MGLTRTKSTVSTMKVERSMWEEGHRCVYYCCDRTSGGRVKRPKVKKNESRIYSKGDPLGRV